MCSAGMDEVDRVGGSSVKALMRSASVVEGKVSGNASPGCGDAVVGVQVDLLVFDGSPEPLHEHVVAPAAFAVHTDSDTVAVEHPDEGRSGELTALIGVHGHLRLERR